MSALRKPLEGWKAIAEYMGKSEKTARTWAAEKGLPVYRLGGGVLAQPEALDLWRQTQTIHVTARAAHAGR